MKDKVYVDLSRIHGQGVFATVSIKQGEPVLRIDDSQQPAARELAEDERCEPCDYLEDGHVVLMQEPERYLNHSCSPNAFVKTINGARYVIALKNIYIGEEITYDYSVNSRGDAIAQCQCGSARCRRTIEADFFRLPYLLQLEYLPLLDAWFMDEHEDQIARLVADTFA